MPLHPIQRVPPGVQRNPYPESDVTKRAREQGQQSPRAVAARQRQQQPATGLPSGPGGRGDEATGANEKLPNPILELYKENQMSEEMKSAGEKLLDVVEKQRIPMAVRREAAKLVSEQQSGNQPLGTSEDLATMLHRKGSAELRALPWRLKVLLVRSLTSDDNLVTGDPGRGLAPMQTPEAKAAVARDILARGEKDILLALNAAIDRALELQRNPAEQRRRAVVDELARAGHVGR
jgi:hypothetical protein